MLPEESMRMARSMRFWHVTCRFRLLCDDVTSSVAALQEVARVEYWMKVSQNCQICVLDEWPFLVEKADLQHYNTLRLEVTTYKKEYLINK